MLEEKLFNAVNSSTNIIMNSIIILFLSLLLFLGYSDSLKINPFLSRRSIIKYNTEKKVSEELVKKAINAAVLAPNHFLTEPWRFYICGEKTKMKIFELNNDKKKYFESIPNWMVVTLKTDFLPNTKEYLEDYAACCAAIQTFMLFMASNNVGSKWMTGGLQIKPSDILKIIDSNEEYFIGVIWFGYPEKELSENTRPPLRKLGLSSLKFLD